MPDPQDFHRLGLQAYDAGAHDRAAELLEKAVQHDPARAEPWADLGGIYGALNRLADAERCCRRALQLEPANMPAQSNLGAVLRRAGRLQEAEQCYRQVLASKPGLAGAHHHLGAILAALGRPQEAERSYRQALALAPGQVAVLNDLGNLLLDSGRLSEAEQTYREVIRLQPQIAEAHANLGKVLTLLSRFEESVSRYRHALSLKPDFALAHSNLIFTLDLIPGTDIARQQAERRDWYAQHGQAHAARIKPHSNSPEPERRLRIGYVSADFCRHSVYYVMAPVVCGHDRSAYHVVCYSGVKIEDQHTARFRAAADEWRSIVGVPDDELAEQIRRDRIDVLVDLSGHSAGNRLTVFARKPAPVQVTAWGHATGTGLQTMDYFFADATVVPREERHLFAEEVFDLPCTICYEPPFYMPEVSPLPCLQGKPFTFGCVNRIEKITDATIAVWGRILQAAPEARLLLKHKGLDDPAFRQQVLRRLEQVGGIRAEQMVLSGASQHPEHLKIFHQVDFGLDPFPQGGGVSSAEALYMGVGVATLRGATLPSRVTASLLSGLELQEWIAQSEDDYVRIALEALRDRSRLASLRQELRQRVRQSSFGDLHRYTRAVEAAYRSMWRRWCVAKK